VKSSSGDLTHTDVSVLGRVGYDLYAEQFGVPLKDVTRFSRYVGGSSANIAVGCERLGAKVGIISCIGRDGLGEFLIEFLQKEGVDTKHVRWAEGYSSSLSLTAVLPPDFPQVFYRKDPADTQIDIGGEELEYIAKTKIFITNGTSLCASPSRESTYRALEYAHSTGVKVLFDVDYRAMSWRSPQQAGLYVRLALPFIDVLVGNDTELCLVAGNPKPDEAARELQRRGTPMVLFKQGPRGTKALTSKEEVFMGPYPVKVVCAIGAGDGFAAGFTYGLLHDMSLASCLRYGNAAAAIVVSRLSCSEAMPTLHEVEALINQHKT